jgi:GTP-binding protein
MADTRRVMALYIKRIDARFVLSAASPSQFPRTGIPEIAMVGRSNVGKSSLINALVKQKIARTSAAPGKSRLANYYLIDNLTPNPQSRITGLYLVDLPGYGYARGGVESVEAFEQLTQVYFDPTTREQRRVAGVFQLVDSRHPDLPQDAAGYAWLLAAQTQLAIVATKIDKLNRSEQVRTLRALKENYDSPVLPVSAFEGTGLDEIWKLLRQWATEVSSS